jgi:hypothetical protein
MKKVNDRVIAEVRRAVSGGSTRNEQTDSSPCPVPFGREEEELCGRREPAGTNEWTPLPCPLPFGRGEGDPGSARTYDS